MAPDHQMLSTLCSEHLIGRLFVLSVFFPQRFNDHTANGAVVVNGFLFYDFHEPTGNADVDAYTGVSLRGLFLEVYFLFGVGGCIFLFCHDVNCFQAATQVCVGGGGKNNYGVTSREQ